MQIANVQFQPHARLPGEKLLPFVAVQIEMACSFGKLTVPIGTDWRKAMR